MKYLISVEINATREKVIEFFSDVNMLSKWQPELQNFKILNGQFGERNSKTKLNYQYNGRPVEMIETILENKLPDNLSAFYEAKNAKNWVKNEFISLNDNTTRWTIHSEFKCSGMLKLITIFFPGMFKKTSLKSMNRFKELLEKNQ